MQDIYTPTLNHHFIEYGRSGLEFHRSQFPLQFYVREPDIGHQRQFATFRSPSVAVVIIVIRQVIVTVIIVPPVVSRRICRAAVVVDDRHTGSRIGCRRFDVSASVGN
jgi:hypothetical protein